MTNELSKNQVEANNIIKESGIYFKDSLHGKPLPSVEDIVVHQKFENTEDVVNRVKMAKETIEKCEQKSDDIRADIQNEKPFGNFINKMKDNKKYGALVAVGAVAGTIIGGIAAKALGVAPSVIVQGLAAGAAVAAVAPALAFPAAVLEDYKTLKDTTERGLGTLYKKTMEEEFVVACCNKVKEGKVFKDEPIAKSENKMKLK